MIFEYDIDYGVIGNNRTDDTVNLQSAITTATANGHGLYITRPCAVSIQDGTGKVLDIPSNAKIKYMQSGSLRLIGPYTTDTYDMMRITGKNNVYIGYANIDGSKELETLAPDGNDYGMGIAIYGASNVTIDHPVIRDCWGDGLYVAANGAVAPTGILINCPHILGVRRNGISVISANGLVINEPVVERVVDTAPRAGIDFEPNLNTDVLKNIKVINLRAIACEGALGFAFENVPGSIAQVIDITVSGVDCVGITDTAISYYLLNKGTHSVSGSITINSPRYYHCNATVYHDASWDGSVLTPVNNPTTIA